MSKNRPLSFLFLGPSGSGKTYGALLLCEELESSYIAVVNGPTEAYEGSGRQVRAVTWEELPIERKNVTYVLDDLHRLKDSNREVLATLTNYTARHNDSNVIIVAHSIQSNGLFSILQFLTDVYITPEKINLRALRLLVKHYFYQEAGEIEKMFLALPKNSYLHLQPQRKTFRVARRKNMMDNSNLGLKALEQDSEEEGEEALPLEREKLIAFFTHLPERNQYENLLDYILRIIPSHLIRSSDFAITFVDKKKKVQRFSLIDYLHYLMSTDEVPPRKIMSFQRYMSRQYCFPLSLIKNNHMKQLVCNI